MDLEQELQLLEMIEAMPTAPKIAPMPTVRKEDPFFLLPPSIRDYLKKIDVKPNLEEDSRIHIDNYMKLLTELHIPHLRAVIYTTLEKTE
jgi:hypothetical protein